MTKADFVKAVYQKAEMGDTLKDAEVVFDAVFAVLKDELKAGRDVSLYGFGTFRVAERAERKGRNPRTGAEILIPAAKVVKFTPAAATKNLVR